MGLVGRAPVFTLTGRLRANASYTARHNTIFQGLAADGAKLALWRLWRAGYRIVNFIHDQVLVEIPQCSPSERMRHARSIREHMIAGMQEVVPDVRIDVSFAASDRWYKDAELKYGDSEQELLLWTPP
jgi:DNA polymerase I-like protein with 3'-5' exonuclease and polymerase domains